MKSRSGFTLVEIVIAISVIAILSAISVNAYISVQQQARDTDRSVKVGLISEALEKYYQKNGEYPSPTALTNNLAANRDGSVPILLAIDPEVIVAPLAPTGTVNSIALLRSSVDVFVYRASPTTTICQNTRTGGCASFTLSYLREEDGQVITVSSRQ